MEPTNRPDARGRPARPVLVLTPGLGQGVVEYGLILSLSAALAVVLLVVFGGTLSAVLEAVGDAIDAAS
jgi:Flp pilus assembly pilin Flp